MDGRGLGVNKNHIRGPSPKINCSVEKHDFESECKKIYQSWLQTKKCKNEHKNRKMRERERDSVCVCVFLTSHVIF